jgi:hypothetical protein
MEQIRCEQGSLGRVRRFRKLVVNNRLLVASFKRQDLFFWAVCPAGVSNPGHLRPARQKVLADFLDLLR